MSPEELQAQYIALETDTTGFRHSRQSELGKILRGYEELADKEQIEKIRTELSAFYLCTKGDSFPGYYQPTFVMTDGSTSPSLSYFSGDRLEYLSKRAAETTNPIHAARFADVAWDLSKNKRIDDAKIAIDRYITCARLYKTNLWGVEYGASIRRSVELTVLIGDINRLKLLKQFIIAEFRNLDKRQEYRYCLDLAKSLEAGQKHFIFTDTEKTNVLAIIQRATQFYKVERSANDMAMGPTAGPNWHFVRLFLEAQNKLQKIFRQTPDNRAYKKSLAETYEEEAKGREPLARLVFLQDAERLYGEAGLPQERDRIRVQLGITGKLAEAEMKSVTSAINIKHEEMDKYIAPLLASDAAESLVSLGKTHHFYPSVKRTQETAEKHKAKYPLASFFPTVMLKNGYICQSGTEKYDTTFARDFVMGIQIGSLYRARFFEKLRNTLHLDADILANQFTRWGYCEADRVKLLKTGFYYYFQGDYIASLHILIPQFEGLLRSLMEKAGQPVHDPQTGKFFVLSSLLRDETFASIAGEDLIYWYQMSLSEPVGLNLRNDISHGLCSTPIFTKDNTELTIHLLLSLTRFKAEEAVP
jgi:hypothetical protein